MFDRILVTLDGSELAELACPYAEEIASALGSEVVLVSVSEPSESEYRHMHELYLQKMAERMRTHVEGIKVRRIVLDGKPVGEIINYVEGNDVDLIIMTSHARSGILPWAMGSVTNKVMWKVNLPVLIAKTAFLEDLKLGKGALLNRILVPLDGSPAGEVLLPYIGELASKLKAEVILLHVVAPGQHVRTVGGVDYILFADEYLKKSQVDAKQYLERMQGDLLGMKENVTAEVRIGDVAKEIIKLAGEANIRLIAIPPHGSSTFKEWAFGSVAHKVVQGSIPSVLIMRPPGVLSQLR